MFQGLTKLFQSRIQTQLLVPLFLLVTIPILTIGSYLGYQLYQSENANIDSSELSDLQEQVLSLEEFLTIADQDIQFLATLNETRQISEAIIVGNQDTISSARLDLVGSFSTLAEARGIYDQIRIID
ncbi:MAG: hypothetical protein KC496_17115, partial [Anaerolineae bacterium]|nr:hypothetical protein [Anaerolineae bacterium]